MGKALSHSLFIPPKFPMTDNGTMGKCMEKESLFGLMGHFMMANTSEEKRKVRESLCLLLRTIMKDFGAMESKKEWEFYLIKMVLSLKKDSGARVPLKTQFQKNNGNRKRKNALKILNNNKRRTKRKYNLKLVIIRTKS